MSEAHEYGAAAIGAPSLTAAVSQAGGLATLGEWLQSKSWQNAGQYVDDHGYHDGIVIIRTSQYGGPGTSEEHSRTTTWEIRDTQGNLITIVVD